MVSIIIPTYKPGEYLRHCLDSLCNQNIAASAYEIIVVLNGPINGYKERIDAYCRQHAEHQIKIITTDVAGVSHARNLGMAQAQGDYLIFVDDDDWVSHNYLGELMRLASSSTIVCSNVRQINEATSEEMDNYIARAYKRHPKEADASLFTCRSFLSSACCKMIPRDVIGAVQFDTRFALGEDSLFMFTVSKRIHHIAFAPSSCTYIVIARHNSASRSFISTKTKLKNIALLCTAYTNVWVKHPFSYSFPLYLSRILATLLKLFRRSY